MPVRKVDVRRDVMIKLNTGITSASVLRQLDRIINSNDLNTVPENDKLQLERIHHDLLMKKNQEYLQMHNLRVSQGKDGRWCTNLVLPSGERKTIRRKTKDELNKEIIRFYKAQVETPTFMPVFEMWIAEKREFGEISESTHTRYMTHYRRFFHKEDAFCKIPLADMTDSILERFVKLSIRDHHLTRKTFSELRILLNGVFKYAKREGYTTYSISSFFGDLALPDRLFQRRKTVNDDEDVFTVSDTDKLIPYLWEKGDIYSLGLILMFETGLRIGEAVALRLDCIYEDRLEVRGTEISYDDPKTGKRIFMVQDCTKTAAGERTVYLPAQARKTLQAIRRLNPFGEFLLMDQGKRIRGKSMNYHLKKACREIGIVPRTTHKIRKTYASTLLDHNVDERLVMQQLGHSDIQTTQTYYHRSRDDAEKKKAIISSAISY